MRVEQNAHTTEEGSRQLVYAAVATPEGEDESKMRGQYINCSRIDEASDDTIDERGLKARTIIWVSISTI
jgi:retinol dehydrogenase 12